MGEEQETVKFELGIVKWAFVSPTMISSVPTEYVPHMFVSGLTSPIVTKYVG